MCVALRHLRRRPPSELLKHVQRRARLHVQRRPRVPKVVPPEVLDPGSLESRSPRCVIHPANGFAPKGEHTLGMLTFLFAQDTEGVETGPLNYFVSFDVGEKITGLHDLVFLMIAAEVFFFFNVKLEAQKQKKIK